jgi:hypothetical protein
MVTLCFTTSLRESVLEVVDQEGDNLLPRPLRISRSQKRGERIFALASPLWSLMLKVAIRAILAVTISSCPIMADAIRGSSGAFAAWRESGAKVPEIRFVFPFPFGGPFSSASRFIFIFPFTLSFSLSKSRPPSRGRPLLYIKGASFAGWISTNVVSLTTPIAVAMVRPGLIVSLKDRKGRVPRMLAYRFSQIFSPSFL